MRHLHVGKLGLDRADRLGDVANQLHHRLVVANEMGFEGGSHLLAKCGGVLLDQRARDGVVNSQREELEENIAGVCDVGVGRQWSRALGQFYLGSSSKDLLAGRLCGHSRVEMVAQGRLPDDSARVGSGSRCGTSVELKDDVSCGGMQGRLRTNRVSL